MKIRLFLYLGAFCFEVGAGQVRQFEMGEVEIRSRSILNLEGDRQYFNSCEIYSAELESLISQQKDFDYIMLKTKCIGEFNSWEPSVLVLASQIVTNISNKVLTKQFCVGAYYPFLKIQKFLNEMSKDQIQMMIMKSSDHEKSKCPIDFPTSVIVGIRINELTQKATSK